MSFTHDRWGRETKEKMGKVEIVVSLQGKRRYISTGVECFKKNWRRFRVWNTADAEEMNETLEVLSKQLRTIYNELAGQGQVSVDDVMRCFNERNKPKVGFLDYLRERLEERKSSVTVATGKRYNVIVRYMAKWKGIVSFGQIEDKNILALDRALKKAGKCEGTRWNYHKVIKMVIDDAINEGVFKGTNPYKRLKFGRGQTNSIDSRVLTPEEFERFKNVDTGFNRTLGMVKDLFIFQTLSALSISDLKDFKYSNCERIDGVLVYRSMRNKTGQPFIFVVTDEMREILKKYEYKLPSISDQKYNLHLKALAVRSGIDKEITSHFARHTGASLLLNKGVRVEIVQKVLGHAKLETTTRVYAKLYDTTIVKALSV